MSWSLDVDVYPHQLPFHRRLLADLLRMRYTFKRRSLMMLATPLPLGESILLLLSPFSFSPSFELTSVDDADDAAVDSVADAAANDAVDTLWIRCRVAVDLL